MQFSREMIKIDPAQETDRIVASLRAQVRTQMRRYGAVVGVSGGVDSAVALALSVRAFGPQKVVALMMPERDSDPLSETLARKQARHCCVEPLLENLTPILEGYGCYQRRDEAIQRVYPAYDASKGYRAKIVLPKNLLNENTLNVFTLTIVTPDGEQVSCPLPVREYLQIVAASNLKQRTRMSMLYYYAELYNYAVIGTANKNEHDQGFFVKYGDSGVDVKTLGHLYKSQVYQLAEYLGVIDEIQRRAPTTDTYSAPCTQEEFFFRLPFETMDLLWFAMEQGFRASQIAGIMNLTEAQVERAFEDFTRKRRSTEYLRMPPQDIQQAAPLA